MTGFGFQLWRHNGWATICTPWIFAVVSWRGGWRRSFAYLSPDATPDHERVRWIWGGRSYYRDA